MVFGLCGGLGHYFDVDPTFIRIIFVLLAMPGGAGILVYLVASFIVPLEAGSEEIHPKEEVREFAHKFKHEIHQTAEEIKKERRHGGFRPVLGAIFVAVGFFLLFREVFPFYHLGTFLWPVLVILLGIYLLTKHK